MRALRRAPRGAGPASLGRAPHDIAHSTLTLPGPQLSPTHEMVPPSLLSAMNATFFPTDEQRGRGAAAGTVGPPPPSGATCPTLAHLA